MTDVKSGAAPTELRRSLLPKQVVDSSSGADNHKPYICFFAPVSLQRVGVAIVFFAGVVFALENLIKLVENTFPLLLTDDMASSYASPDSTTLPFVRLMNGSYESLKSPLTATDEEKMRLLAWEDSLCMKAARPYQPDKCQGAPFLYVTFHGGRQISTVNTVCKYTRDGCALGSVLMQAKGMVYRSMRGMAPTPDGHLLVAHSYRQDSRVLEYGGCHEGLQFRREPLRTLLQGSRSNMGLIHPYGLAFQSENSEDRSSGAVYVSAQGTFSVLRYNYTTALPLSVSPPISLMIQKGEKHMVNHNKELYLRISGVKFRRKKMSRRQRMFIGSLAFPGQFVQLGGHDIRGIAFDADGNLFVADKSLGILMFDSKGYFKGNIYRALGAIGMHYDREKNQLLVGLRQEHEVIVINLTSWSIARKLQHKHMKHPSGITVWKDNVFILSQASKLIFRVDPSGNFHEVLRNLPDLPEAIMLSDC